MLYQILFSIGFFLLGVVSGWFLRGVIDKGNVTAATIATSMVNIIIVVLWTASVTNSIFQWNDSTTPWFLHALMGGVMGFLNPSVGNWVLKMLGRDISNPPTPPPQCTENQLNCKAK